MRVFETQTIAFAIVCTCTREMMIQNHWLKTSPLNEVSPTSVLLPNERAARVANLAINEMNTYHTLFQ